MDHDIKLPCCLISPYLMGDRAHHTSDVHGSHSDRDTPSWTGYFNVLNLLFEAVGRKWIEK